MHSPFLLHNDNLYQSWRTQKLEYASGNQSKGIDTLFITIDDANNLTSKELESMLEACKQNSLCLYQLSQHTNTDKTAIHKMAKQLGLSQLDNNLCSDDDKLTTITSTAHKGQHEYIPYTNKQLSWHTDGYYNPPKKNINSMLLHCINPAKEGGDSFFLDHELAYIFLRDEEPEYIRALMQADALTIPANVLDGKIIRKEQAGPVFSINNKGGLHMRYSARKRNIEWKQSSPILEAALFLENLLNNCPYIIKHKFKSGEGVICKNILHCRTSFVDSDEPEKKRLLYRGRYYDNLT